MVVPLKPDVLLDPSTRSDVIKLQIVIIYFCFFLELLHTYTRIYKLTLMKQNMKIEQYFVLSMTQYTRDVRLFSVETKELIKDYL